jgi:hypothetical protein
MAGPNLSALIESQLPDFIVEDYPLVTNLLSKYYEAISISEGPQDIINNFEKYLDVDTFAPEVLVKTCKLQQEIANGSDKIDILVDRTDGFPDANGLIMIDQEIFLYTKKTTTEFKGCIRGYSARTEIGDLYTPANFIESNTQIHKQFAEVSNLSNLLLAGLIKQYEEQYTSGFPYQYLKDQTNKNLLVKRIKDFYKVKGTPQSLEFIFQILFSVRPDIIYPKDNVFKASESGWNSKELLLVEAISGDIRQIVGNTITQTPDPYNPELKEATAIIDNIVGEPYQGSLQYTLTISPGSKVGEFAIARRSFLMTEVSPNAGRGDRIDVFSTIGFPERDGRLVIGEEEITYSTKTSTQFVIHERDAGREVKRQFTHKKGVRCFTKNNLQGEYVDEFGITRYVKLRIYGLVAGLTSDGIEPETSAGLEYDEQAENYFDVETGGIPYVQLDNMIEFKSSGFFDTLPLTNEWIINQDASKLAAFDDTNVGTLNIKDKLQSNVQSIYRDDENYYIASSGFPSYPVGPFDNTRTPQDQRHLKILPRTPVEASTKPYTDAKEVGLLVNGVSLLNHKSQNGIDYGSVEKIEITRSGRGYTVPPKVNIEGDATATASINGLGEVTSVTITNSGAGYSSAPEVTFTSGSGGQFIVTIQQGEIASIALAINSQAEIIDAGQDYTEEPNVFIFDSSGKGKGALFTCQIDTATGRITGFTKLSGGFDYQEATTTVTLSPKSSAAEATASLTRWRFNSYLEKQVDNGNASGIVEEANDANFGFTYGHIIAPTSLKIQRSDNVDTQGNALTNKSHSPILGWAYDGNPIYGSFGYDNPYQDASASNPTIKRMGSSWRLKSTRGSNAPNEATYSLGRFCNDYEYVERLGDLDANNGRFCVTPEFPNGTYAYFMTTDSNETPTFPYSIGEAYYNVPVEENWKTKSKQDFLPDRVRRRAQNENDQAGELLTSRISGISYGPIQNVEVHQSSANFTNEDVLYVDNSINDSGSGLFAAVNEIKGQTVAALSCNTPKNNYFTTDSVLYLNHNSTLTQANSNATAQVIGKLEENDQFVVKNVSGTFNKTDTIDSDTEVYNLTFSSNIVANYGDEVIVSAQSSGVAHEIVIGKVLRNVFDKNTVIVELQNANPNELTTLDTDGVTTITIPRSSYTEVGFFQVGQGVNVGQTSAQVVAVRSLSKGFKLLDIEDKIAVLRTATEEHGLAVGDDVIITVQPNSSISTQQYYVETKKYHTIQLTDFAANSTINDSGLSRLSMIGAGSGFTPSTTFNGIQAELFSGTNSGITHGTLDITTNANGGVESVTIASKGSGYTYGDVITVPVGALGGGVSSNRLALFVDAAGFGRDETLLTVTNSTGFSIGDKLIITDEIVTVTAVAGNNLTVTRGSDNTEVVDHVDDVAVRLITPFYRFNKDSIIQFGNDTARVDEYDSATQQLTVYYIDETDIEINENTIFVDQSSPTKQVGTTTVEDTSLRFRFRKEGSTEWFRNISLDIQKTYRYIFDTSDASLVNRNLKFYENVYRTKYLVQAFTSTQKPGTTGSYISFQLGYGIPIDGTSWETEPVLAIPPKIYYGEASDLINSESQHFTLVEDPFAGKHKVFYGYQYEFAFRLDEEPQQEGFTNIEYYTDSLYAIGSIKSVKVISGGSNYTMPPMIPGVFLNKRFRGSFTPLIEDGKITSVTVVDTGLNYSQPIVLLEDTDGGVNAAFRIELRADGSVARIIPTNEGEGYGPNTTLRLYESDVKLFGQGDQIGKLSTLEIISSGKDFNNDPTLLPTINPPIVMTLRNMPDKAFLNGELIEQRDSTGKICATGRVDFWRNGQNILRLKNVTGKFEKAYDIYGTSLRSTADIQKIYVAKIDPVIGPTSTSIGSYQSDRSKLSAVSQKVQDGIYYQDYSYVVKSTVSINDWRDFVKKFTHPAGFNLFGEVLIESFGNARKPATIDTPQSGIKDNGFGSVITVIEPGVIGVTAAHKSRKITQSHVRVDSFQRERGLGSINYSEQNNVEIEVFDLALSPGFDGAVQVDGTITGTRTFTLFKKDINEPLTPYAEEQLIVTLDGVLQNPNTAYTVSGSTITFAEAPLGPYVDAKTGIHVPGVTFYGKSVKFQDDANNATYMLEANDITSLFDGTTTVFPLGINIDPGDDHLFVSLDGVIQEPGVAYTLQPAPDNTITFTEPPRQVGKIVELDIGDATNFQVNDFVVGSTSGARGEIVAKRYFVDHRFLNAADLLINNSNILAEEAVGILDATSKFDGFSYPGLGRNQCITDLRSVLQNIARDLQLGGNSNTWDAAREYLLDPADPNSDLKHIEGEVEATLWAMKYFKDMSILAIRNHFGITNLTGQQRFADTTFNMTPTAATYTASSGNLVLTIPGHELSSSDKIAIATDSLTFTCAQDNNQTNHTYPRSTDPAAGIVLSIASISGDDVTINVGASPSGQQYDHTFVSSLANSIGKYNDVYNKTNAVADEFIDSANLLTANRNFLAEEAVAMMLANPANTGFTIPGGNVNCVDDVKDMLDAIIWNLQYGGNNRVWDAAELYIDRSGALEHITGQVTETLEVFANVKTLAADVIRNNTITAVGSHGITQVFDNSITVETNECAAVESGINTLVDLVGNAVQNPSTFESNVTRTLPYIWPVVHSTLTVYRDLDITIDPAVPYCAQVESAINTLFGIVTTTIQEAAYNNNNHLLNVTQDFPNPNKIQVEMTEKEFLAPETITAEASLLTATATTKSTIAPGTQQKFFGFKHGKYYQIDSIEAQFNDAQTIFELERNGVPFYAERNQNLVVIVNGVIQVNKTAYSAQDNILVFNEAPSTGSECIILYFYGLDPERVLLGYNIEPLGTFKKFFKLTVDQQVVIPTEGAQVWVSTDPQGVNHPYVQSFARGRIYKQSWTPGAQNILFVEDVTAQKINWQGGTISITRDRGASPSLLDLQVLAVEELVNSDLREKLFNRQDRIKSNLKPGDLIKIDGEADTRSIVRAAKEALVTSGYDSDTSVDSFFRSYEYEVVINVGPYSGQIEGQGAQAVARIDAEVKFHTLVSSRQEGVEFLNGDVIRQHQDQNDPTTPVIWSATVKNYAASRKTIELYSNYIDGSPYTDPTNGFRIGEKIHIENVAGTTAVLLEYGQPGSVNSVVLSKRDNTAYYDSNKNWLQDNIWNNGANLLGASFVPQASDANNKPSHADFSSSLYSHQLEPQISSNYREPPVMIFRSQPSVDSNGDPVGSPTGGGARANAVTVRGEIVDLELISKGSGYKVPPQVLFTRGYFVFRKDPLDIVALTTFGIEPTTIDSSSGIVSFIDTIFKGGAQTQWSRFASYAPLGDTLVFGNGGSTAYRINKSQQVTLFNQTIIHPEIEMHPQPEVYINLAPENVECEHKETMVTQTQMTGGVQGISCAITKFKNTETKVTYNSGCVENRAWNNDQMIAADQYSTGSLGPVIGFLESFKFEIQPQSNDTDGVNGYYQDSAGRTINYVMGDMNIGFFSDRYPNLTIGDFEDPSIVNSQVNDPGDNNPFNFQQGAEFHFSTTTKATVLDNVYGADIVLANSTKGFPRYNGQIIIGNTTTNKHELLSYTEAQSDRFIGVQRLNPLSSVEVGNNFAYMTILPQTDNVSLSNGGTGVGYNGRFVSDIQYYWFYGGTGPGDNRSVQWQHIASSGDVAPWDGKTTITTEYIRGNMTNGGETPGQDLTLKFWTQNTGWVVAGAVWEYSTASFNNDVGIDWSTTTLNIPTSIQTEITAGNDFWMKYEQLNIQQNGADYFAIRSFWLNDNDNAASYPAGTVVMSANKI